MRNPRLKSKNTYELRPNRIMIFTTKTSKILNGIYQLCG